jgi:hypothetical protein
LLEAEVTEFLGRGKSERCDGLDDASRRLKKTENAEAMIWKLLLVAEKSWRALNAPCLLRYGLSTRRPRSVR